MAGPRIKGRKTAPPTVRSMLLAKTHFIAGLGFCHSYLASFLSPPHLSSHNSHKYPHASLTKSQHANQQNQSVDCVNRGCFETSSPEHFKRSCYHTFLPFWCTAFILARSLFIKLLSRPRIQSRNKEAKYKDGSTQHRTHRAKCGAQAGN